jgi:hypothetical protein
MTSEDDFAPIWEESILLAEHEAVQASVDVGGWLSAALDDPNVCDQMKADINRWFSSGFLYLDSVRQLMQADREAVRAEQAAELAKFKALAETLAEALEGSIGALEFSREYHKDLGNEDQAFAQDRLDAATKALLQYKEARDAS